MLTPREIVFRLNGGGDVTPLGGVDVAGRGASSSPVPPVAAGRAGRRVVVPLGDTSGEKMRAERVLRQVQAVALRALPIDLEDLDVDDDLGARLVVLLDDLLEDLHDRASCRAR